MSTDFTTEYYESLANMHPIAEAAMTMIFIALILFVLVMLLSTRKEQRMDKYIKIEDLNRILEGITGKAIETGIKYDASLDGFIKGYINTYAEENDLIYEEVRDE